MMTMVVVMTMMLVMTMMMTVLAMMMIDLFHDHDGFVLLQVPRAGHGLMQSTGQRTY